MKRGVWPVAGCDEAGRGPLAGPVVAAAVILDPDRVPRGLNDSKKLDREEREQLYAKICASAEVAVAFAPPSRIDRDNILRASLWALALRGQGAAGQADAGLRRRPRPHRRRLRLHGGDLRRRHRRVDRRGVDRRQGDPRPPDDAAGARPSRLRLRAPHGLRRARASGGAGEARADRPSPPLVRAGRRRYLEEPPTPTRSFRPHCRSRARNRSHFSRLMH